MTQIKWTDEKIHQLVNQQSQSGLSVKDFCKKINFNSNYFYGLKSKLKLSKPSKVKKAFLPVKLESPISNVSDSAPIKLKVFCFEFCANTDRSTISDTLQVVLKS